MSLYYLLKPDNNEIYRLRISVRNTGNPDEDFVTTYTPAVSCYL
jgi:hypothetical protein